MGLGLEGALDSLTSGFITRGEEDTQDDTPEKQAVLE